MKILIHMTILLAVLSPLMTLGSEGTDITEFPADCDPITAEQIKSLEESFCDSNENIKEEEEVDPWQSGEIVEHEPTRDGTADEPDTGSSGPKEKGKFFGGVGGLSVIADQPKNSHIYNKSRLNTRRDKIKRANRRKNQKFIESQNETEKIKIIADAVIDLQLFLQSDVGKSSDLFQAIQDGDWKSSLNLKQVAPLAFLIGTAVILYRGVRLINIPGYIFLTGSAGAYADLDTEYKDFPERILEVEKREKLEWLLTVDEIRINTFAILIFAKNSVCKNHGDKLLEDSQKNYCQSVDLILE